MTIKDIEKSYGICGLVCSLCSYSTNCGGCNCKKSDCDVKNCCQTKEIEYCFLCDEFPCDKDMLKGIRIRAFNTVAKKDGLPTLAKYLHNNFNRGIFYHRADGLSGDYDKCKTEEEIIELLKNGNPDPYERCPEYESKRFFLRLVSAEDSADLLECYKNPTISVKANSENCTFGYNAQTFEEMNDFIRRWLESYSQRHFIRFSIIDKQFNKAIGTIEIFDNGIEKHSVLRIDVSAEYENEECLSELLKISDSFFHDLNCEKIVTKIMPKALCRMNALKQNGYAPYPQSNEWARDDYFIKIFVNND